MKTPYETMFLLPPTMGEDKIDEFVGRLQESVEKKHGEVTSVEKMGVRKTTYAVNKLNSAYYILFQYKGRGETISEVERLLKNSDEVMKYLSTKITSKPVVKPEPKKAPAPEPVAAEAVATPETPAAPPAPAPEATPLAGNGTQE